MKNTGDVPEELGSAAKQVGSAAKQFEGAVDDAGNTDLAAAHDAGEKIQQNPVYRAFVSVGLVAYGLVHLLIAWIAVQIAWGGQDSGQQASNTGALSELASKPFGGVALVVCAVGLYALVLWQLIEAAIGHTHVSGRKRLGRRLGSVAKAVTYAVIGFSATRVLLGAGGGGGEQQQESLTAQIMQAPGGRIAIALLGLVVVGVGIFQIVKGIRRSFYQDLDGQVPGAGKVLGVVGYIAKGIAVGVVGFLFTWAAWQHNPEAAGDTNSALRSIVQQPFGPFLLSMVAAGIAAFGLFCFVWARYAKHEKA